MEKSVLWGVSQDFRHLCFEPAGNREVKAPIREKIYTEVIHRAVQDPTYTYQINNMEFNERSAYPHPGDFKVMRPEYLEQEDGFFVATITITPFKVTGKSSTMAGARRAALYDAEKTYKSYHPSYRVTNPYPSEFADQEGQAWKLLSPLQREKLGDYSFTDADGEEDYADIEQMLMWDIRPVKAEAAAE